jgi:hypothetical protein
MDQPPQRRDQLGPHLDASSPAMQAFRAAEPHARELQRLSELKPTKWEPPTI